MNPMGSKSIQIIVLIIAAVIALIFVKLMFDMSRSMDEMTGHISAISRNVGEMQRDMHIMNESILRMEKSIQGLGRAFSQGSEQFQQMSPPGMMRQVFPEREGRAR